MHEVKPERTERRNRRIHYHSWRLQQLLSEVDGANREKVSKDVVELNHTINQLNIMDIHRIVHPTTAEYTFL